MTVIVWDGYTLAADKQSTSAGLTRTVTKIRKIRFHLCGVAGDLCLGGEMMAWFERGAIPAELPAFQRTDNWVSLLVITPDRKILKYEQSPYPIDFTESVVYAMGAGRDYAIAAVHLGCDAAEAVKVASMFENSCGMGCDTLSFD